jgi:hypothetical protein
MAELFGRRYTRRELESLLGNMNQVAGITLGELADGRARGVRTADIRTGSGFSFTILLDRAMDIGRADFCGRPLCWRSVNTDVHPAFYEEPGLGWLRTFGGGLLTTCGLMSLGGPSTDAGQAFGLHGRISTTPAERISVSEEWIGNDYVMAISGETAEGVTFFPCLRKRRTIVTKLGANSLMIRDEVTNVGPRNSPLMILYHVNLGFPALAPESRVLAPSLTVHPNTPDAEIGKRDYAKAASPARGYAEKVYEHKLASIRGRTAVALVNDALGFGVYERFRTGQLPVFNQWKMMGESEYVMGMEPSTNGVFGRATERKRGRIVTLRPGQSREFELEIGVLDGPRDIAAIEKEIRAMRRGRAKIGSVND